MKISWFLTDADGLPAAGATAEPTVAICRVADGHWLDFADGGFKNTGWVMKNGSLPLTEPGLFGLSLDTSAWVDGQYLILADWSVTQVHGIGTVCLVGGVESEAAVLSQAGAQTACSAALTAFDPATAAGVSAVASAISDLNDLSAGQAQAACSSALTDFAPATAAGLAGVAGAISALNDLSLADILGMSVDDSQVFASLSFGDLLRKIGWILSCRLVVDKTTGQIRIYKQNGTSLAATISVTASDTAVERSMPAWE